MGRLRAGRLPGEARRPPIVVTERAVEQRVTSIFAKLGWAAAPEGPGRVPACRPLLRA
jgi:hypothetical protein